MLELPKWVNELLSGKLAELAGSLFYGLGIVYGMSLLGIPFERYFEDFEIMVLLGIGLTSPFAAKPALSRLVTFSTSWFSVYQKKKSLEARTSKIADYSKTKKQILLVAFMGGENLLTLPYSLDLAEMIADDVLEKHGLDLRIMPDIWKELNAHPNYRDDVLERMSLLEEVKPHIATQRRIRRYY